MSEGRVELPVASLQVETRIHWCGPACPKDCSDDRKTYRRYIGPWEEVSA